MFADIIPNAKIKAGFYTYRIPKELEKSIKIGQLVKIPLGPREVLGIVLNLNKTSKKIDSKKIKPIKEIIVPEPVIDQTRFKLANFIAEYYFTPLPLVIFSMLPPLLRRDKITKRKSRTKNILESYKKEKEKEIKLTKNQQKVWEEIRKSFSGSSKYFLLHGITGSGKTEIYLKAITEVLKKGMSAIYIVPEISLTPQTIQRCLNRFGKENLAISHSHLNPSQRLAEWNRIKEKTSAGKGIVVIGSRSAIFSPIANLSLIIIDEEHDLISFKSDQSPRYELHPVAEKLAQLANSILILGSATPLVESFWKAKKNYYHLLVLSERIDRSTAQPRPLPKIKIVDLAKEMSKNYSPFSYYLDQSLNAIVKNKRKALVFINRRGAATLIRCQNCGWVDTCPNCQIPFVYHLESNKSMCHYCGKTSPPAAICPNCRGLAVKYLGAGTQKVESEIKKLFPNTKVLRLDQDVVTKKESHKKIFDEFKKPEAAILVGTQMIAHGWDIPEVDLVGILGIDLMLNFPDFRGGEKTFSLITQLAGRAGRADIPGLVVVQTFNPENLIIQQAASYDFEGFIDSEIEIRQKYGYPPFSRIIKLSFSHKEEKRAREEAKKLFEKLKDLASKQHNNKTIEILGPMPPLVPHLRGRYWQQIIIKVLELEFCAAPPENETGLRAAPAAEVWFQKFKLLLPPIPKGWIIDIDPLSLL